MRYKPKRENYANGYYGEIDYNVMLERYCTYLENQNKQLRLHVVSVSFSKDDMKKCADFWNGKHIEQKYFDQYLNER